MFGFRTCNLRVASDPTLMSARRWRERWAVRQVRGRRSDVWEIVHEVDQEMLDGIVKCPRA